MISTHILVVNVLIARQRINRHQAFDEQIRQFDKQTVPRRADHQSIEFIADAVLHELRFLPFHKFAFGIGGPAFR